jgi:hypothetical protein
MTDDALVALAKAATPGPWEADYDDDCHTVMMYQEGDSRGNFESQREWKCEHDLTDDEVTPEAREQWEEADATARFIAACSPDVILSLVERVQRAEKDSARLAWLEARVQEVEHVEVNYTDEWSEPGDYGSVLSSGPAEFWLRDDGTECGPTLRDAIDAAMQQVRE